jgi:thioredoxin 1
MPAVEKLEKEYADKLKVAKVNTSGNRMLCAKLKVMGLPAYLFYKNGIEVKRLAGETTTASDLAKAVKDILG